jgi:hypothetical protein
MPPQALRWKKGTDNKQWAVCRQFITVAYNLYLKYPMAQNLCAIGYFFVFK